MYVCMCVCVCVCVCVCYHQITPTVEKPETQNRTLLLQIDWGYPFWMVFFKLYLVYHSTFLGREEDCVAPIFFFFKDLSTLIVGIQDHYFHLELNTNRAREDRQALHYIKHSVGVYCDTKAKVEDLRLLSKASLISSRAISFIFRLIVLGKARKAIGVIVSLRFFAKDCFGIK